MRCVVTACLALVLLAGEPRLAAQAVFHSGVELTRFGVTVTGRDGALVTGLTAADFQILEDGRPQTITSFARGTDDVETAPDLHLGLLFDTSGSMEEDIDLSRSAAIRFLNALPDARDITLVEFDTEVRLARYGQADFPRLVERIRGRAPEGMTALYDALGVYLDGAEGDTGRTVLLVYTDGGDTRSAISFGDVMTLVKASHVTIYAVGFLGHQAMADRLEQRMHLQQIAEATGGQAYFPTTMTDVEAAYDKVVAQVRGQYLIGYTSTNARRDGTWRKVDIRVTRPDLADAKLLARRGYFGPYDPPAATGPRR